MYDICNHAEKGFLSRKAVLDFRKSGSKCCGFSKVLSENYDLNGFESHINLNGIDHYFDIEILIM